MTDNQQRAAEVIPNAMRLYYPDVIEEVAAALNAAEERGRTEVAARVQAALNGALMVPQAEIRRALAEDR